MANLKVFCASALCATTGLVCAVPEVVTDVSGYVTLTANDPGGTFSFNSGANWSDGAAPSGDKDYIIQKERVMRIGGAGGVFAGRSLTLDNGRVKTSNDDNSTATINDLRIYGGRLEQSTVNSTKNIDGNIHVLGTASNPSRFSGSSGRIFKIAAALHGTAESVFKVMMTEEDAGSMNGTPFECWINRNNLATYRGCFRVEAGTSSTGWGRSVALCTSSLNNLGAGDPDANTPVLTLKDRAAFYGANAMSFANPSYTLAIEGGAGTLGGRNATGVENYGVRFGGSVKIRGVSENTVVYVRSADAPLVFDDVVLENIGRIEVENGVLRLGPGYKASAEVTLNANATVQGTAAAGGALVFNASSAFAPGTIAGNVGTLSAASAAVSGVVTGLVDFARADDVLTADRLALAGKLSKGAAGRIVFKVGAFPDTSDWMGSVRLLSATNLGEADGFGVDDFELTGLPATWTDNRSAGVLSIETDGDMKHLVWTAVSDATPVVRILPLGDSITYGSRSSRAGYRQPLYDLLVDAGYRPDFVGTLQTSEGTPVTDPDHEGHRGWVIARAGNPDRCGQMPDGYDGIYEHVEAWLDQVANPHFILLHIGTNDLLGDDFAHAKDRLALLVDRLVSLRPAAWVVVTTLLNRSDNASYNDAIVTQFNPFVAEIARRHRAIGHRVAFLDMNAAVPPEELADGVHPNDTGYGHMAQAWFGAIRELMPSPATVPSSVQTELVTLTGVNPSAYTSWDTALMWDNGFAPIAGRYYFVPTNTVLRTPDLRAPAAFAGESLILNGGNVNLKHANGSTADANWVVYGGSRIAHGCAGAKDKDGRDIAYVESLGGTFDVRGTVDNPALLTGSGTDGDRTLIVRAALIGAADAMLRVGRTSGEGDAGGKAFRCFFSGDNAAYKGRFRAASDGTTGARWEVGFESATALGAPVADGAKLTLGNGMLLVGNGLAITNGYALALEGDVWLYASGARPISGRRPTEGIYLGGGVAVTGTGSSVVTLTGSTGIALDDVAFSGVAKIVAESGSTMRVYPGYSQPELPIEVKGNLADASDGLGPVTLKSGGYLQPGYRIYTPDCLGRFGLAALTVESGGFLMMSVVPDGEGFTNDFIRVDGNLVKTSDEPIEIRFDRYPNGLPAGTRIPLVSAANLGTDIQGADFRFTCVDNFLDNYIEGTFEVAPVDGMNTLFFVQSSEPVVVLTGADAGGTDSWATGRNWSNREAPSAAYAYLVAGAGKLLRHSTNTDPVTFAGRSLSIANEGDVAINGLDTVVSDLRLCSDGILSTRNDGAGNRLRGTATVYAATGRPFNFEIETGGGTRTLNLEAVFQGSGDLRFRYYHTSYTASGSEMPKTFFLVTGESPHFTGGIELHQRSVCVDFKNERAMGGPSPAFRPDRLLFTSNATLRCSASYVMSDPTRGITMGGGGTVGFEGGRFEVLGGQTLVVSNLISGATSLRKAGSGVLALCCATNAFSGTVRNLTEGGVIAIGAADAVARASLQSCYNAVWRVDAPEGMTVKSLDAVVQNGDGNQTLLVRPGAFAPGRRADGRIVANLVRFKGATAADAERALSLVKLDDSDLGRNWTCELSTQEVADGLLVLVTARQHGLTIYFR